METTSHAARLTVVSTGPAAFSRFAYDVGSSGIQSERHPDAEMKAAPREGAADAWEPWRRRGISSARVSPMSYGLVTVTGTQKSSSLSRWTFIRDVSWFP